MGIAGFLKPTRGEIAFFLVLAVPGTFFLAVGQEYLYPSEFSPLSALARLLVFPGLVTLILGHSNPYIMSLSLPISLVYWYALACIYVTAYNWIEGTLRRKYPQINARWEKRKRNKPDSG